MSFGMDAHFAEWLQKYLDHKGWNQSDLARAAGINRQVVHSYLSYKTVRYDVEILKAIARALDEPPEAVFRAAGMLPAVSDDDAIDEQLRHDYERLSPEGKRQARNYIRYLASSGSGYPVPSLYTIFDELSNQKPDGPLMIVRHPDEIGTWLDTTAFDVITRAFVDGQGFVVEIVPKDRD